MKKNIEFLIIIGIAAFSFTSCKKSLDQPPIADAGTDQTVTLPTDSILLIGSGINANGTIGNLFYKWTTVSGPAGALIAQPYNAKTIVRNLREGIYRFELSVTNLAGSVTKVYVTITVLPWANPSFSNSIGQLSIPRWGAAAASAANKILFAGGSWGEVNPTVFSRVDIYDTSTRTWSTAELSDARVGIGAVTVGNKVLFAGGTKNFDYNVGWFDLSTRVDIYDAVTNTWTTSQLPGEQLFLWGFGVAVAAGSKAYFYSHYGNSDNVIYVFDVINNSWSSIAMNGPERFAIAANTLNNKIFFAGGRDLDNGGYLNRVDIFNTEINGWTVNSMSVPRELIKSAVVNNKVLFAGGQNPVGNSLNTVEIYNNTTQTWSVDHLSRSAVFAGAVSAGQKAIFLQGDIADVYDASSNAWSVVNILIWVEHDLSVIIASGNSVYVTGAKVNGTWTSHVWKLGF